MTNKLKKGFYIYNGFDKPELVSTRINGLIKNIIFQEGYLTDSVDTSDEVLKLFFEELNEIKRIENTNHLDINNQSHAEHINNFLFEYGIWLNPSQDDLQQFNISKCLDKNAYISDLFSDKELDYNEN